MPNATILKFNYPESLLFEYDNWVVLLRPEQVTVGSLVLACKGEYSRLSELPASVFAELARVTSDLEGVLEKVFRYDKINYLLLMMVDKHVHFHVLPRYSAHRDLFGATFVDASWPDPPNLAKTVEITSEQTRLLLELLKSNWPHSRS
jgi:diadenosine tetraphosphate (Ap4A) HIT family hydrolase